MTVYLDASLLDAPAIAVGDPGSDAGPLAEAIRHLVGDGHAVVGLGDARAAGAFRAAGADTATALPTDVPHGSWLLTAEPSACGSRIPGVTMVLVGPPLTGRAAIARCDRQARDLRAAMLEILSSEMLAS